jgi:tRNA dimethylallyltransferase
MNLSLPKLLVIGGPTASGKKKFALEAAERFRGEIVSADSRKVYRRLDIGTAKPSPEDRIRIPHHLIDIVDPDEPFSAGEWARLAAEEVRGIFARGRLPILSGGTGFYISAFLDGLSDGIAPDPEVRAQLTRDAVEHGPESLHARLAAIDPVRAAELPPGDTVRVMRALEIYETGGVTVTELRGRPRVTSGEYDVFFLGIGMERPLIYRRIDERVDAMIRAGLVDEVRSLLMAGYSRDSVALDTVGYREWFPFIDGAESFDTCLDLVKRNTRRYAKRQFTWFRNRPGIRWIDFSGKGAMDSAFEEIAVWLDTCRDVPPGRAHGPGHENA